MNKFRYAARTKIAALLFLTFIFAGSTLVFRAHRPWPLGGADVPRSLLTATAALFNAGLADPRGGEYRVIKVRTGNCWAGDAGTQETHGWVLPAGAGAERKAVCWNGLVYPVLTIGKKADLRADVLAAIKEDVALHAKYKDYYRHRQAEPEARTISYKIIFPIKTCLLLRLGEGALAEKFWHAWTAGMNPKFNRNDIHLKDPYAMLAVDWAWARFDRAIGAHMWRDDALALADARALVGMRIAVEAEAKRRGLTKANVHDGDLWFLQQLPQLLADQERRAQLPKRNPFPLPKDKTRRIALLIQELENASAPQIMQPGGVDLGWSWVVQSLIEEGDAAVEPLLECLERDQRLTRSVHFWRNFSRHRNILGVHEAAYVALAGILKISFFGVNAAGDDLTARGEKGRRRVAANIRAYWRRFEFTPLENRWYLILADDTMPVAHWMQAARNITQPANGTNSKDGKENLPRGEKLRRLKNPSITDLLVRRIQELREFGVDEPQSRDGIYNACKMAGHLAQWDLKNALPELKAMINACRKRTSKKVRLRHSVIEYLGPELAALTQWRLRAGDKTALDDYAAWLRTLPGTTDRFSLSKILKPMWQNPNHPAIVAAADEMFNDDHSPWTKRFLRTYSTRDLFRTPMIGLPGFRKRLLIELKDRRSAGKLRHDPEGGYGFLQVAGAYNGGAAIHFAGDPLAPTAGAKESPFRVCDYYAYHLSLLDGTPRCEVYWPETERDKAVAACATFLKKYGERFKYERGAKDADRVRMSFPIRERPATENEVRDSKAIFAFQKGDKARACKIGSLPIKARWKALKKFPNSAYDYVKKRGATWPNPRYHQEGQVWQAEEVFRDGKWQRYYGFVGEYIVAKVAAEEMEFPAPDNDRWTELEGGIDCRLTGPQFPVVKNGMVEIVRQGAGQSLKLRLQLRNRRGTAQFMPAEFIRKDPNKGALLHPGIRVLLDHAANDGETEKHRRNWVPLTTEKAVHFQAGAANVKVEPAETFAEVDLPFTEWFNITEGGGYRIQVVFRDQNGGFVNGRSRVIEFNLAGPR